MGRVVAQLPLLFCLGLVNESVQPVYSVGQLIVILCGYVKSGTRMHMEMQDQKCSGQQVVDPGYTKACLNM